MKGAITWLHSLYIPTPSFGGSYQEIPMYKHRYYAALLTAHMRTFEWATATKDQRARAEYLSTMMRLAYEGAF